MNRRGFLFGAAATLVAAPAIVRVASIMPVKALPLAEAPIVSGWRLHFIDALGRQQARWLVNVDDFCNGSYSAEIPAEAMDASTWSLSYVVAPVVSFPEVARAS